MNYSGPSLIMETLLMETPALAPGVPDITHGCRLGGPCSGAGWGARAAVKLAVRVRAGAERQRASGSERKGRPSAASTLCHKRPLWTTRVYKGIVDEPLSQTTIVDDACV